MPTFQYVQSTDEQKQTMQKFYDMYQKLYDELQEFENQSPHSRSMNLALTKLEESAFWLNKSIWDDPTQRKIIEDAIHGRVSQALLEDNEKDKQERLRFLLWRTEGAPWETYTKNHIASAFRAKSSPASNEFLTLLI